MNKIKTDDGLVLTLYDSESPQIKAANAKDQANIANADGFTLIFSSCNCFGM